MGCGLNHCAGMNCAGLDQYAGLNNCAEMNLRRIELRRNKLRRIEQFENAPKWTALEWTDPTGNYA